MTQIIEKSLKQRQFVEKPWEHQLKLQFVVNWNWHVTDADTTFTGSTGKVGHERV